VNAPNPKVIQIAIQPGFDGPDRSGNPFIYVLYDNGEVWRCQTSDTDGEWEIVDVPNEEAALP
jgi:hypothetical protein